MIEILYIPGNFESRPHFVNPRDKDLLELLFEIVCKLSWNTLYIKDLRQAAYVYTISWLISETSEIIVLG